ncbi:MAG: SLC13 family permease [Hyphomicrobiaceae bacterium]
MLTDIPLIQLAAFAIIIAMLALFIWGRWRYDLVAVLLLLVATLIGVVPSETAFSGFSNPVVIIIASVLVVSRAIQQSGLLDGVMRLLLSRVGNVSLQIGVLTACVTLLSAFVKNVGTLGIFMPIAIQTARRSGQSPSIYLMPLAFGSLIGGTITQIGTSPNLLITTIREQQGLPPYRLFDFLPVGLPLSLIAIVFLAVGWRLLPKDRIGTPAKEDKFRIADYTTELRVGEGSPLAGRSVGDLEDLCEGALTVTAITRGRMHQPIPNRHWILARGDIVTAQADTAGVKRAVDAGKLELVGAEGLNQKDGRNDQLDIVEAIVTSGSPLVDSTARSLGLRQRFEVNLLAVSRGGRRITAATRLQSHAFHVGDVLVLQGWENQLAKTLEEMGCLPLADRSVNLGRSGYGAIPILILAAAMVLASLRVVSVEIAFFGSAVLTMLSGQISMKEAYEAIEWPVIVMLGALIPIGHAMKDTGAATTIGDWLTMAAGNAPPEIAVGLILVTSMILTPFLHHAAAVLVLGPVAAVVAANLGYSPDPFLMAVALGCACDFLTPIGHQNNLLVMEPGGYRFGDYWRLGLPLSILVAVLGTPLIMWVWPL